MAIPLDTLARAGEFPVSQVEMSGNEWVTQYRGQILPLVRLAVVLEERRHRCVLCKRRPRRMRDRFRFW